MIDISALAGIEDGVKAKLSEALEPFVGRVANRAAMLLIQRILHEALEPYKHLYQVDAVQNMVYEYGKLGLNLRATSRGAFVQAAFFSVAGVEKAWVGDVGLGRDHFLVSIEQSWREVDLEALRARLVRESPIYARVTVVDAVSLRVKATDPNIALEDIVEAAWAWPDLVNANPILGILSLENAEVAAQVSEALTAERRSWVD